MVRTLNINSTECIEDKLLVSNSGAISGQFIGQQWLNRNVSYQEPELFYWNREKRGAAAEVDYLFEIGRHIVPVEVKAGTTGSLKSLQLFAASKKSPLTLRFNLDGP